MRKRSKNVVKNKRGENYVNKRKKLKIGNRVKPRQIYTGS